MTFTPFAAGERIYVERGISRDWHTYVDIDASWGAKLDFTSSDTGILTAATSLDSEGLPVATLDGVAIGVTAGVTIRVTV